MTARAAIAAPREGPSTAKPALVPGLSRVSALDAGEFHALAVGAFG